MVCSRDGYTGFLQREEFYKNRGEGFYKNRETSSTRRTDLTEGDRERKF